jgi:hypothetical protein
MPWHDIGVVLHNRKDDLVAGFDALAPERIGDEIDRFGGIPGEDDLLLAPGIEEGGDFFARVFVSFGGFIGEEMQPPMHVGVLGRIGCIEPIEHRARLLRRRRIIEIDERLAIDLHRQDREIRPDAVHVIDVTDRSLIHLSISGPSEAAKANGYPRAPSQAATFSIRASRKPACSMPSMASPRKA